jgi:hypothetical protein
VQNLPLNNLSQVPELLAMQTKVLCTGILMRNTPTALIAFMERHYNDRVLFSTGCEVFFNALEKTLRL